jgi:hypothetical protein
MQLMVVGGALLPRKCVYVQAFLTADGGQGSLRVVETRPLLTNHHVAQLTREPGVTTGTVIIVVRWIRGIVKLLSEIFFPNK